MDILLISRCPPFPLHLGDRLIPYHLAQQLATHQHTIDLLAFYDQPADLNQIDHYQAFFRSVQLIREPRRPLTSYMQRLLRPPRLFPGQAADSWSPEMWRAIEHQLAAQHYDVIQLFGGIQVYEYRALIKAFPNLIVPYESYSLYLTRELAQQSNPLSRLRSHLQRAVAERYEAVIFNGYDRVVALSETDADALRTLNPTLPVRVIPNGIDLDYFTEAIPTSPTPIDVVTLLFLGNLSYAPNIDAALYLVREIFPLIKRQLPTARLLLVGSDPAAEIRVLASADITVTGRVPDVRPYYRETTIFISPLRFGAGIKNKMLEAMAMGKPIVATRLSGDGIGLVDGQHVLYGDTAPALADAVLRLVEDSQLRHNMAVANRHLIESRYTWTRVAEQYEALYAEINAAYAAPR